MIYVFDDNPTKAVYDKYDRSLEESAACTFRWVARRATSLSRSLSGFAARCRPCWDILFLLYAWNKPPMTSALYPYVRIFALGISFGRKSSIQNIDWSHLDFASEEFEIASLQIVSLCFLSDPNIDDSGPRFLLDPSVPSFWEMPNVPPRSLWDVLSIHV